MIVIAVLVGLNTGLIASLTAIVLNASPLDTTKWAGATFIATTMLLLKIRELLQ
ncbi:hypothetical protein ACFUTV_41115 [Streptomyces sp. NPDC057298]|uniref:hypothetical protein n=1 Tax=Streptomyces sp. NPDC057298 TaxID=3346091 RepID=UPI00362F505A